MADKSSFIQSVNAGYTFKGKALYGRAMLDGETLGEAIVHLPLGTMNRHGADSRSYGNG